MRWGEMEPVSKHLLGDTSETAVQDICTPYGVPRTEYPIVRFHRDRLTHVSQD